MPPSALLPLFAAGISSRGPLSAPRLSRAAAPGRSVRDYTVYFFGSSFFKIARLLFIALICVHFFACAFYRVKKGSAASQEDIDAFYQTRGVKPTVSRRCWSLLPDEHLRL